MSTRKVTNSLGLIYRVIDYMACAIVLITTVAIGTTLMTGVVYRYVLSSSLSWSSEVPVILFPWLIMGGVVMAAVRNEHLGVDYVVRKLPIPARKVIAVSMCVLVALTMAALVVQSKAILQFIQYQTTPVLGLSASWAFYSLPVGASGVLIVSVIQALRICIGHADFEEANPSSGSEGSMS